MSKRFSKIYVEITNKCNLACSFCSKDTLPKREMSVSEFEIVIRKIKDYTDNIYLHVKGEPLLHSNFEEILDICDKYNMKVSITTNGTLLDKRRDILLSHPIKQINVSLHSQNNDRDYFDKVFNVCDSLSKKTTIVYRIWTLPSLNLDKVSTNIVDKIEKHYKLTTDIIDKIQKDKNIKIGNNMYIDKDYEFIWPKLGKNKCTTGTCLGTKSHIGILSNGVVVPCCLDSSGIINLGNIFKNNMESIINSKMFKDINIGFQNHVIISDLCKNCHFRKRFK